MEKEGHSGFDIILKNPRPTLPNRAACYEIHIHKTIIDPKQQVNTAGAQAFGRALIDHVKGYPEFPDAPKIHPTVIHELRRYSQVVESPVGTCEGRNYCLLSGEKLGGSCPRLCLYFNHSNTAKFCTHGA
jgi:hypothetical protein